MRIEELMDYLKSFDGRPLSEDERLEAVEKLHRRPGDEMSFAGVHPEFDQEITRAAEYFSFSRDAIFLTAAVRWALAAGRFIEVKSLGSFRKVKPSLFCGNINDSSSGKTQIGGYFDDGTILPLEQWARDLNKKRRDEAFNAPDDGGKELNSNQIRMVNSILRRNKAVPIINGFSPEVLQLRLARQAVLAEFKELGSFWKKIEPKGKDHLNDSLTIIFDEHTWRTDLLGNTDEAERDNVFDGALNIWIAGQPAFMKNFFNTSNVSSGFLWRFVFAQTLKKEYGEESCNFKEWSDAVLSPPYITQGIFNSLAEVGWKREALAIDQPVERTLYEYEVGSDAECTRRHINSILKWYENRFGVWSSTQPIWKAKADMVRKLYAYVDKFALIFQLAIDHSFGNISCQSVSNSSVFNDKFISKAAVEMSWDMCRMIFNNWCDFWGTRTTEIDIEGAMVASKSAGPKTREYVNIVFDNIGAGPHSTADITAVAKRLFPVVDESSRRKHSRIVKEYLITPSSVVDVIEEGETKKYKFRKS